MMCVFGTAYGVQVTITSPNKKVETPDYRNSMWGMNWEEVKAAEGDIVWETEEPVGSANGYYASIGGIDFFVTFSFDNNGLLCQGTLVYEKNNANYYFYITDFDALAEALTNKYGKPTQEADVWMNDYYKNTKSEQGTAVALGYFYRLYIWETDNTIIQMVLGNQSYEIILGITYQDKGNIQETDMSGL